MATELIAPGTGAASSADFTLADGETATIAIASTGSVRWAAKALVELKAGANVYNPAGKLGRGVVNCQVSGPGVFRARRLAGTVNFGIYRD
jgi:hypothetical protein